MDLSEIIRGAIGIANDVTDSIQLDVQHYAWIDSDDYGEPEYDTVMIRKAVVELKQRKRRLENGDDVEQRASLIFLEPVDDNGAIDRREPIDPRDKIVLPNGFTGPILAVQGQFDPGTNRPYLLEVVLG